MRITLDKRPAHLDLRAFGMAAGLACAFAVAVIAAVSGTQAAISGAVVGATLVIPATVGLMRPDWLRQPYRVWNGAARRYGAAARPAVMGLMFFVVFRVVAMAGARLQKNTTPPTSGWSPKKPVPATDFQLGSGAAPRWVSQVRTWSRGTPNQWSRFLLPFLLVLSWLAVDREVSGAEDIYTLY